MDPETARVERLESAESEPQAPVVDAADVLVEAWLPGMLAEAIERMQRRQVN